MTKFITTVAGANFAATGLGQATPIWTPDALGANLMAFFDADDITSMDVNANKELTALRPSAGSAFTLINQQPTAQKPVLVSDGWNGGPCIVFSPASGGTTGSLLIGDGPSNSGGVTVFVVGERGVQNDATGGQGIKPMIRLPGPRVRDMIQSVHLGFWPPRLESSQRILAGGQHLQTRASMSEITGWGINERHIGYGEFLPEAVNVRVDGGPAGTGAPYYDISSTKWSIGGSDNSLNSQTAWRMKKILVMRGVPGLSLRQKIEGYFAWTCGLIPVLAGDHPYVNDGPYV